MALGLSNKWGIVKYKGWFWEISLYYWQKQSILIGKIYWDIFRDSVFCFK